METITEIFGQMAEAQAAAEELMANGWTHESVTLVAAHPHPSLPAKDAEKGAVIGGLAGLFLGLSEIAVPGVGLILVGGWLAATLLGAGMGAVAGGLGGLLAETGVPHAEAGDLASRVQSGEILVSVRTEAERAELARTILSRHAAAQIQEQA